MQGRLTSSTASVRQTCIAPKTQKPSIVYHLDNLLHDMQWLSKLPSSHVKHRERLIAAANRKQVTARVPRQGLSNPTEPVSGS